jgi:hypothetical protein
MLNEAYTYEGNIVPLSNKSRAVGGIITLDLTLSELAAQPDYVELIDNEERVWNVLLPYKDVQGCFFLEGDHQ